MLILCLNSFKDFKCSDKSKLTTNYIGCYGCRCGCELRSFCALHFYCLSPTDVFVFSCHCCPVALLLMPARRDVMSTVRVGYSRSCLLTLYRPIVPLHSVQQRLRELDLLAVCRLSCHHLSSTVCLRCYRGCCAGRSRRSVSRLKPFGNGAYIVTVPRPSTRLCPTSRRHCYQPVTLIDVRTTSSPIASTGRLMFSVLIVCSLTNKVDGMLELRRDCHIDVMCLAETWHDTDSVAFRRLCLSRLPSGRSSTPATTVRAADDVNQPWWSGSCVRVRHSSVVHRSRRWSNFVWVAVISSCVGFFFCHRVSNLPARLRGYHDHVLCWLRRDPYDEFTIIYSS